MNKELLRPFDLEAARAGAGLYSIASGIEYTYVGGPDKGRRIAVDNQGTLVVVAIEILRMQPLCWVEGRPVYPGDVLYGKWPEASRGGYIIERLEGSGETAQLWMKMSPEQRNATWTPVSDMTWNPPKVKKEGWISIYPPGALRAPIVCRTSHAYPTKSCADNLAAPGRLACIKIEWEE